MNAFSLPELESAETQNSNDAPVPCSSESGIVATTPREVGGLLALAIGHALSGRGIDGSTLLATIGVTGRTARIPSSAYAQAWVVASELANDPHLGLRGGHTLPPLALGVVDLCMATAPTLKEALLVFCREHSALAGAEELFVREEADAVVVEHVWPDDVEAPHHVTEWLFAVLASRITAPEAVWLAHPASDDATAHARAFSVAPRFGETTSGMRFSAAALAVATSGADAMMHQLFLRRAQTENGWRDASQALTHLARAAAVECVSLGGGSVDEVAKRLGMPRRTLQRKLAEEGTTCKQVLEGARFDAAMAVLARRDTTIEDAAAAAGFYGTSAFYRAFRRWTGASPRSYERQTSSRTVSLHGLKP